MRVGRVRRLQHDALATLRTRRAAADRREASVGQRSACLSMARSRQTRQMARTQHDKKIMQQYWKSLFTGKYCSTCDNNVMAKSMIDGCAANLSMTARRYNDTGCTITHPPTHGLQACSNNGNQLDTHPSRTRWERTRPHGRQSPFSSLPAQTMGVGDHPPSGPLAPAFRAIE